MCKQQDIFNDYKTFLKNLAKTGSSKLFTNGGKEYASILMSVLLDNTNSVARIFSYGFRPDLVSTSEYKQALERFLETPYKEIRVMVETEEAVDQEPIRMLKEAYQSSPGQVSLKLITPEDRKDLITQLGGGIEILQCSIRRSIAWSMTLMISRHSAHSTMLKLAQD